MLSKEELSKASDGVGLSPLASDIGVCAALWNKYIQAYADDPAMAATCIKARELSLIYLPQRHHERFGRLSFELLAAWRKSSKDAFSSAEKEMLFYMSLCGVPPGVAGRKVFTS